MYTDTDSVLSKFNVPDIYDYIKRDLSRFDTSDYPSDNIHGVPFAIKRVLDLMKDENNWKIITKLVGLRAKLYVLKLWMTIRIRKNLKALKVYC